MGGLDPVAAQRVKLIADVAQALATDERRATLVVDAFDTFFATPLANKFRATTARDIAKRNPFVYASLGAADTHGWVTRVLADKLTSIAEGLVGQWMEEVARIMCDGFKPGSGVDLQRETDDGTVELYAIQSTTNTKNAGGSRSDVQGRRAAAGALRAQRRHVVEYVGYLFGRSKTTTKDGITRLSSNEFWEKIAGDQDFLPKLLHACTLMSPMYVPMAADDVTRIKAEADSLYSDTSAGIDWKKVLTPPSRSRPKRSES